MFRGLIGAAGRAVIDTAPTIGQVLREYGPAYLTHIAPVMSWFLAEHHKMLEQNLQHIEDRNTRAIVAAMMLSGIRAGLVFGD